MKKLTFLICFLPLFSYSQEDIREDLFVLFYNVENLFDTINNELTEDDSFLPTSDKKYDSKKYQHKLKQIGRVIDSIKFFNNNKLPDIIGLWEVENMRVIKKLLEEPAFENQKFKIIHKDSPDKRGIDCALLINNNLEIIEKDFIKILNPDSKKPTRDIVYAKLKYNEIIFNIFVNHWPSRWGGQEETNYKRVFAAKVLKNYIDINTLKNELTIIMGDFNDYPNNESLSILTSEKFFNLMNTENISGSGSYNYKGDWNWLDQIILSNNFKSTNFEILSAGSFQKDFMMYESNNIKLKSRFFPSRTFGGNFWYGGFSDHLPIYLRFKIVD